MACREDLVSSGGSVFSSELLKTFLHQARYVYCYSNNWSLEMFDKLRYFFLIGAVRKIWRELLVLMLNKATLRQQFSSILHLHSSQN